MVNHTLQMIVNSMVVDYIRVRKSNIKELKEMIEQRSARKTMWVTVLGVASIVLAVALVGFLTTL